jgi:hypothetical protein
MDTVLKLFGHHLFTDKLAAEIRRGKVDDAVVSLLKTFDINPYEMSVREQIDALLLANSEEGWNIDRRAIEDLAKSAPAWPNGFEKYRSFRIRFGHGADGVKETLLAHINHINRVAGSFMNGRRKFYSDVEGHRSGTPSYFVESPLHLAAGNDSHVPVVEWVTVDLAANFSPVDSKLVPSPNSVADEGLVLAWLFSERLTDQRFAAWRPWYLAGYETQPHAGGTPCFSRAFPNGDTVVMLSRDMRYDRGSYCVPVLLKDK